ncbi:MAG: POTRA domain-containing protein, partial [Chthoniobacterales bacterium]
MNSFYRFFLLATTLLAGAASLHSQLPPTQGPIVKQIDVQYVGAESMTKERVLANLATQVGQPYSEQAVEQDIRSLYATGTVANVRMFGEPFQDGVKVTVLLQGRPIVAEVLIEGAEQISQVRVRKEIGVKPGQS